MQTYYCPPALAKCWWEPLLARGVQVDKTPLELTCPNYETYRAAIPDLADGSFDLKAGGVRAVCSFEPFECPPRWELGYTVNMESFLPSWEELADPPLRRHGRGRVRAAVDNLEGLAGRVLVASGACAQSAPRCCYSAFHGTVELLDKALDKLEALGAKVRRVPERIPATERHAAGLAIDECARVHCWGVTIRVFAGDGIHPATRRARPYLAIRLPNRSLNGRSSTRLAGACEVFLVEAGAVPIEIIADWPARPGATGSPDRVLAWMSDRGERICL